MEKHQQILQNEYLRALIPNLDRYSFLCGTEGKVYFVDDDFVVKTYFEPLKNADVFQAYFNEIKSFWDSGLAVPKIYSWDMIPCEDGKFRAFILEERIKGKPLFDLDVTRLYEVCKKFCSTKEFDAAVENRKNNPELLGLILREHILDFLNTNKALNQLPETEVEKFVSTAYNLGKGARFSWPDIQAGNVMFDKEKLTVIDNAYLGHNVGEYSDDYVKTHVLRDMFLLFYYNENVNWTPKFKCGVTNELKRLKAENEDECFLAMRRFVKKANEMYQPVIKNAYDYDACKNVAYEIFEKKKADEICGEIQKEI